MTIAHILHFGLCVLKARVPWIVSPHFGQTCGTGEWGGAVCAARRIWAAVNVSIFTYGACLPVSTSPINGGCESGHEVQSNNQKPMLSKYAAAVTVNPSLIMCVKGFGVLGSRSLPRWQYANLFISPPRPFSFKRTFLKTMATSFLHFSFTWSNMGGLTVIIGRSFIFPPQFPVYTHYAMCQGAI